MEEAVVVLRQSLAEAKDKSVTIVTVGFLTNIRSSSVLTGLRSLFHLKCECSRSWMMSFQMTKRDLLLSPGDEISPMSGVNLVKEKVNM